MIVVTAAAWIFERIACQGELPLEEAIFEIARLFGTECVHADEAGDLTIAIAVLKALRLLAGDAIVWDAGEQLWRSQESAGRRRNYH